jgi:histidyl-tRNA synthetase
MSSKITGPKGAPDLFPPRSQLHDEIISRATQLFKLYGYGRIETPVFEATQLFEKGLEPGSEVVTKQMYSFEDRGGRSLTLRPDMTAPVVRSVLEHGLERQGKPLKLYYVAPIFRQEKPQAGRQRQFTQVGIEALGSPGPEIDAEVIQLAMDIYLSVGLKDVELALNSIGHPECRAVYIPKLQEYLRSVADQLCEDCRRKIETNPLRTFDCKVPSDRELLKDAPVIVDYLCEECASHYDQLKSLLRDSGVRFTEDPRLVRGLDYYTRTAFEFTAGGLGSQNAVGGGGRYDGLAESLGGGHLPGIGFGLGVERIVLALEAKGVEPARRLNVFVVSMGDRARKVARAVAANLRSEGYSTDLDFAGRGIKAQFKAANQLGAEWVVVIGDKEIETGLYTLKRMSTGEEQQVQPARLAGYLAVRT